MVKPTIFQSPRAIFAMAEFLAGKEVKAQLKAHGVKAQYVPISEIRARAKDYVSQHPQIVDEAKRICEELHQRELWKRERQRQQRLMAKGHLANISSAAQAKARCETTGIPVQQSRSKVEA
jgi:hypothetical protein